MKRIHLLVKVVFFLVLFGSSSMSSNLKIPFVFEKDYKGSSFHFFKSTDIGTNPVCNFGGGGCGPTPPAPCLIKCLEDFIFVQVSPKDCKLPELKFLAKSLEINVSKMNTLRIGKSIQLDLTSIPKTTLASLKDRLLIYKLAPNLSLFGDGILIYQRVK
jgi:hypothetical protein